MRRAVVPYIRVSDYLTARPGSRARLAPTAAGVYLWMLDLSRLHRGKASPSETLQRLLLDSRRSFSGRVEPYTDVVLAERLRPLSSDRQLLAAELLGTSDAAGVLAWTTVFQRPLYVGKAGDIAARLRQHLRPDSRLNESLAASGLSTVDCCFIPLAMADAATTYADDDSAEDGEDEGLSTTPELAAILGSIESLLIRLTRPIFNVYHP